jgi:hypothetical protein
MALRRVDDNGTGALDFSTLFRKQFHHRQPAVILLTCLRARILSGGWDTMSTRKRPTMNRPEHRPARKCFYHAEGEGEGVSAWSLIVPSNMDRFKASAKRIV